MSWPRFYVPKAPACGAVLYILTFPNGKQYVGVTVDFRKRFHKHWHGDFIVGRAMRKYGRESISFEFIPFETEKEAYIAEKEKVTSLNTIVPHGYNMIEGGTEHRTPSAEVRAKISVAGMNRTHSLETRAKMSLSSKGRIFSSEHRARLSAAAKIRVCSLETRAKMSAVRSALNKGRTFSEETRRKISEASSLYWKKKRDMLVEPLLVVGGSISLDLA